MILKSSLILCLIWMFYQDLRFRAIYWISFPLLVGLLIAGLDISRGPTEVLNNTIYNLIILLAQMAFISIWFSLKYKKLVNITTDYLGWGDLLFLLGITVYFSPVNYFLFYVCSLIAVLIISMPGLIRAGNNLKIPLAGLQALFFAMILVLNWMEIIPDPTNDNWMLNHLERW